MWSVQRLFAGLLLRCCSETWEGILLLIPNGYRNLICKRAICDLFLCPRALPRHVARAWARGAKCRVLRPRHVLSIVPRRRAGCLRNANGMCAARALLVRRASFVDVTILTSYLDLRDILHGSWDLAVSMLLCKSVK